MAAPTKAALRPPVCALDERVLDALLNIRAGLSNLQPEGLASRIFGIRLQLCGLINDLTDAREVQRKRLAADERVSRVRGWRG